VRFQAVHLSLLLAIIAHPLAKGKLFFVGSESSLIHKDMRQRGLFVPWGFDNSMPAWVVKLKHLLSGSYSGIM